MLELPVKTLFFLQIYFLVTHFVLQISEKFSSQYIRHPVCNILHVGVHFCYSFSE